MGKLPILSSKVVKITQDIWLISLIQRRNLENYLIRKKNDIQEAIDWFPAISRSGLQCDTIYISFAELLKALKGKVKKIPFNLIIHAAVEYSPNLAKNQSFFFPDATSNARYTVWVSLEGPGLQISTDVNLTKNEITTNFKASENNLSLSSYLCTQIGLGLQV